MIINWRKFQSCFYLMFVVEEKKVQSSPIQSIPSVNELRYNLLTVLLQPETALASPGLLQEAITLVEGQEYS